jgi:peroxiredoxin
MIGVGTQAPDFELSNDKRQKVKLSDYRGRPVVLLFHPLAFTPVCTNELQTFNERYAGDSGFEAHNAAVFGISVDSTASKAAWAKSLGGLSYDLLSDFYPHGQVSRDYGVFFEPAGFSERAAIVVDREGKVAFAKKYDITEAPDVDEILRAVANV